jgi:alpha-beta hydrolase superfamily lysophospholipase
MSLFKKKKENPSIRPFRIPGWLIALFLVTALILAGAFLFIYQVMPGKVAESLVKATQARHAPLKNPGQFGLKYQDVEFHTADGISLKGWWIPASVKKPLGTVILTHGAFHNRDQILTRAVFLQEAGYQVLAFDLRGHGESGPSPLSGGLLEAGDFTAATDFLNQKHWVKKPLVLFGFSLGAICALRAGAADPVDAVIADSPLPNVKSYVSRKTIGAPFAKLPGFLLKCLQAYDLVTGLHLEEKDLDLAPVMKQITSVPVMLFSGEKDDLALSSEIQRLFDKCPSTHRMLVYIPDAGHEQTYSQYPVIYEKAVLDFLTNVREGFPEDKHLYWDVAKPNGKTKAVPAKK